MQKIVPFDGWEVLRMDLDYWIDGMTNAILDRHMNLHPYGGVATNGLTIGIRGESDVYVTPGTAYDNNGERIRLTSTHTGILYNNVSIYNATGTYLVTTRYANSSSRYSTHQLTGITHNVWNGESYAIQSYKQGTDTVPDNDVILGEVVVGTVGTSIFANYTLREMIGNYIPIALTIPNTTSWGDAEKGKMFIYGNILYYWNGIALKSI